MTCQQQSHILIINYVNFFRYFYLTYIFIIFIYNKEESILTMTFTANNYDFYCKIVQFYKV